MFQDLGAITYHNPFYNRAPKDDDTVLIYQGDSILAVRNGSALALPTVASLPEALRAAPLRYAFSLDERAFFLGDSGGLLAQEDLIPSRDCRQMEPKELVFACAVGESLHRWYNASRFCGRCGSKMLDSETERARVCPVCGLINYPKICPAVIVAVHDGDRLLLTRYRNRPFKRYALVAGFNEIGETTRTLCGVRSWRRPACMLRICVSTNRSPGSLPTACSWDSFVSSTAATGSRCRTTSSRRPSGFRGRRSPRTTRRSA